MRTKRDTMFWMECRARLPPERVGKRFPSEDLCVARLTEVRWPEGFVCPRCGGLEFWRLARGYLCQCRTCKAQISITAGTALGRSRQSVSAWFLGAEYLIRCCNKSYVPTIKTFGQYLELKYTAARILRQGLLTDIQSEDSLLLRCIGLPAYTEVSGWPPLDDITQHDMLPG